MYICYFCNAIVFVLLGCGASLEHLLAAGGAAGGGHGPQAPPAELHKLSLQSSLPAGVRPPEPLIEEEQAVQREGDGEQAPAHRAPHLAETGTSTHIWCLVRVQVLTSGA